jgi:2-amino-4-hydroxy-6-hydroxymethyldihydropteridine diphosphokinase
MHNFITDVFLSLALMNTAYLLLGGNKGNKLKNLQQAIEFITLKVGVIVNKSDVFVTAAWGNLNQPDFINQAISLHTSLSAADLLEQILIIEGQLGRIRSHEKWMERTMDIDILFYNDEIIDTPNLKIPHPFIQERKFALVPMAQIACGLIHPLLKKSIAQLTDECNDPLEVKALKHQNS